MRKESGFTLIELLVTISVATVLIGIGVPSMVDIVRNNRRAAAVNALVTDLQHARSTATSRGVYTTLCHSVNGSVCSGADDPDWSSGWILFTDSAGEGMFNTGDTMLAVDRGREGVSMPSTVSRFTFSPGFSTSMIGGTVAVCVDGEHNDRWIVVGAAGRPRLTETNADVRC